MERLQCTNSTSSVFRLILKQTAQWYEINFQAVQTTACFERFAAMDEKRKDRKKENRGRKRDRFSKKNDSRRGIEKKSKEKVFQSLQVIHIWKSRTFFPTLTDGLFKILTYLLLHTAPHGQMPEFCKFLEICIAFSLLGHYELIQKFWFHAFN